MSGRVRIQHACEICGTLFYAHASAEDVQCPVCGNVVDEEDWASNKKKEPPKKDDPRRT